MRWLKHTVSILLILAAVAVAMATAFTNHSADYGSVPLPQGGVVQLPEGKVIVYYRQGANQAPGATFAFQVTPVAGGAPVPLTSDNGTQIAGADQRSQTIGEMGAVAKLDVPSAGEYDVSGSGDIRAGRGHARVRHQRGRRGPRALEADRRPVRGRPADRVDPDASLEAPLGGRDRRPSGLVL